MPANTISAMPPAPGAVTDGSKNQMNGSSTTPTSAVNSNSTATLLSLKKRSTRYLSKWTEMAQSTGPENANTTHDTRFSFSPRQKAPRDPHATVPDRLYGAPRSAHFRPPRQ